MPQNLYDAFKQWAIRPADERFASLDDLYDFARQRKEHSSQFVESLNGIQLDALNGNIFMNGTREKSYLSNWSFGQLSRLVGAPAKYLRTLPAEMAVDCMRYGMSKNDRLSKILIRDGKQGRLASSFTSESYGRIWDADIIAKLRDSVADTGWHVPKSNKGYTGNSGLYASDRDMFAFMINDEDPVEIGDAKLGKGFFCWNSETGSATFGLTTFLYNYVCDNHIVWGADRINELKIFHKKFAPERFKQEAIPIMNEFSRSNSRSEEIKYTVDKAMTQRIGGSLEETLDWFKNRPFTRKEIESAYQTGRLEGEDVTSLWGVIQGLTATARNMPYINKRVDLERRAGLLLK